jgi:transcriptional regulator with XRE-family HTH domain
MSMKRSKSDPKFVRGYDRTMLRAEFVSLFWSVIADRRKRSSFTFQALAKSLGKNKGEVSRWFSGRPNWTINTIANLANALDLEIRVEAVERSTGRVFTPQGEIRASTACTNQPSSVMTDTEMPPPGVGTTRIPADTCPDNARPLHGGRDRPA